MTWRFPNAQEHTDHPVHFCTSPDLLYGAFFPLEQPAYTSVASLARAHLLPIPALTIKNDQGFFSVVSY